jgi:hypothetical protein
VVRSLCYLSLALLLAPSAWGQRYELVEPSGLVSGAVDVQRGRLIVYERSGEQVYFNREARYDSADGRFLGYFSFKLNRVLRFPKSGSGLIQTADLGAAAPRFQNSERVVRPADPAASRSNGLRGAPLPRSYIDPYVAGYRSAVPPPQSVLVDSRTVANPPLAPVRVSFRNDGPRDLKVTVVDLKDSSRTRSMRIQPGEVADVQLVRDASAKRTVVYRVSTPSGETTTREVHTEVQPKYRYEVIVHEWVMQSIAIDRTGKSPDRVEEINFQGRPLGRFPLPPGPQLQSGTIDVDTAARSRGNERTIAPIYPREQRSTNTASPLERAVLELQRAALEGR